MRPLTVLAFAAIACSSKPKPAASTTKPLANPYPAKPTGPAIAQLSNAPGVKVTLADVGLEQSALDRTVDPCIDFYQFACGGWIADAQIPDDRGRWDRFADVDRQHRAQIKAMLEEAAKGIDPATKKLGDFYASCMDEAQRPVAKALLAKVQIKSANAWLPAITELHAHGIWAVWRAEATADGMTLGATDRVHDTAYVTTRLASLPAAAAADVIAIETELARGEPVTASPPKAIDWRAYWKRLGVDPGKKIVVTSKALATIDRVRAKFKPAQWASYFTFRLADRITIASDRDRSAQCVQATREILGDLLAPPYTAKYFPPAAKTAATAIVDELVRAFGDTITRVEWLTDVTRQGALAKLAKQTRVIGYAAGGDVEIRRDDYVGNVLRAGAADTKRRLSRSAEHIDATATSVVFDSIANTATVPAGVLQPPFFGPDRAVAVNLGGLALVVGRGLAASAEVDFTKLAERTKCVETQYAGFEAAPKAFVNGKLTLAENIADLGGVKIAFAAYRALRKDAPKVYVADGFAEDQQFFIAVGQALCTRDRPDEVTKRLAADPFAPPKFRVYGALRNMKEFSEAFACAPGTPMNPATSCSVW